MGASAYHYVRVEVQGGRMNLAAIGLDGQAFDSFSLSPPPVIAGAVVNAASGTPEIGRGGLVSVFGWQFSAETIAAESGTLPFDTRGLHVRVGDAEARILFASSDQINVLLPGVLAGRQTMRIMTPGGAASAEIEIIPVAQAIFPGGLFNDVRTRISLDTPCRRKSRVTAFVTGMAAYDGSVSVILGNESTSGTLEGTTELPGVQRVHFEVPSSIRPGSHALALQAGGVRSNTLLLPVGPE